MTSATLHGEVSVLRPFQFAGRAYEAGQRFPWRQAGCSERRLGQMVSQRLVGPTLTPRSEGKKPTKE